MRRLKKTDRKPEGFCSYLLHKIPKTTWERAMAKAKRENTTMRHILITLTERWAPPTTPEELAAAKSDPTKPKLQRGSPESLARGRQTQKDRPAVIAGGGPPDLGTAF